MLVVMGAILILHKRRDTMVEIDHAVCEEVFLIVEMDFFGWNTLR